MATRKRELVYRDGKPAAVILDIAEYEELLERAEDLDDLRALRRMREHPLRFRSLSDILSECSQDDAGSVVARDARPSNTRVHRPSRSGR
ncbi:MAG: type II toxin-antitoxin system Phd/YefM family antitoxin [candidate division WOR-3 bacterium]|nr:type II toxin-antitoxin system Phd/YefM family antitoxin [candidate division WOR-3 bacterium]